MDGPRGSFPKKSGFFQGRKPGNFGNNRNKSFKNNRNDGGDNDDRKGPKRRNFDRPIRYRDQEEEHNEDGVKYNKFQKKVDSDRAYKKRWEEREKGGEQEWRKGKNENKFEKNNWKSIDRKKNGQFKKHNEKNPPAKGTSTEYNQLANSDDNDSDIPDVSDMFEDNDDDAFEIPLINSGSAKKRKPTAEFPKKARNGFNALGETTSEAAPPVKKQKFTEIVKEDEDDDEEEDTDDEEDDTVREDPINDAQEEGSDVEEGESDEDDEDERKKFREEIANMPLGKVKEMKEKLGIKLFNKTYFGVSEQEKKKQIEKKKEEAAENKKLGQHRPKEMSTKRPVSSFRNIYGDHEQSIKKKKWDPRFDERAGDYKEVCFENNYKFLDDIRSSEIKELKKEMRNAKTSKDQPKAAKLKDLIQKMENREKSRMEKRRQMETKKELHDENIQRMLRGEAPVFKTKGQIRRIDMEKKYDELKKDNKLDKYLQRKAKKQSGKEKKARPFEGYGFQE